MAETHIKELLSLLKTLENKRKAIESVREVGEKLLVNRESHIRQCIYEFLELVPKDAEITKLCEDVGITNDCSVKRPVVVPDLSEIYKIEKQSMTQLIEEIDNTIIRQLKAPVETDPSDQADQAESKRSSVRFARERALAIALSLTAQAADGDSLE